MGPIDDAVLPLRLVAQVGGRQVLDGVQRALSEGGFAVGFLHTDVEGGDDFAVHLVFA